MVFTFGVGQDGYDSGWVHDVNHSFLKSLSLNNNGFYRRIKQSNTDSKLSEYFDVLSKPLATNIKIMCTKALKNKLLESFVIMFKCFFHFCLFLHFPQRKLTIANCHHGSTIRLLKNIYLDLKITLKSLTGALFILAVPTL